MIVNDQQAEFRHVGKGASNGLLQIATIALREVQSGSIPIDQSDVEDFLEAFRAIWPDAGPDLTFLGGMFQLAQLRWHEAAETFRSLVDASKCLPRSRAMLAYALSRTGDPEWRFEAEALRESTEPGVELVLGSLLDLDDFRKGRMSAEEVIALGERRRERAGTGGETRTAKPEPDEIAPHWMNNHLRV